MPRPSTGRARNEQARLDVLRATLSLAGDGVEALTVDAIANRAGVGKQTIYRWWSSKWLVILDALLEHAAHGVVDDADGSPAERLVGFLTSTFALINGPGHTGPVLKALMARAQHDAEFAVVWRDRFIQPRREALLQLVKAAGVTEADAAVDLIFGGMWYRLLVGHAPLDEAYAVSLVRGAMLL